MTNLWKCCVCFACCLGPCLLILACFWFARSLGLL